MKPGALGAWFSRPTASPVAKLSFPPALVGVPLANPLVRHVIQSMPLLFVGTRSAEDSLQSKAAGVTAYPLLAAKFRKIVVA